MDFLDTITISADDPLLDEAYRHYSSGNYKLSFAAFSDLKSAEAVYCVGFHYLNGKGIKRDVRKALECFTSAMDSGYVPAVSECAQCHGYGIGTDVDDEKAFSLFTKAAEAGDPYGMAMLSMMYHEGDFVRRDDKLAEQWMERCEKSGDMKRIEHLGLSYFEQGNYLLGRICLMRSAVMGSPVSAKALECIYDSGAGVYRDEDEAGDWFETADTNGWESISSDDLGTHRAWFLQFMDEDDLPDE